MDDDNKLIELVRLAQRGDTDAKNELVRQSESMLRTYVYRVTLDRNAIDDIVQEALFSMAKSLGDLKKAGRFKSWLYRIGQSKIQQHYRDAQKDSAVTSSFFYKDLLEKRPDEVADTGLDHLLRKELLRAVMVSMNDLNHQYRAVLTLRCFDDLDFDEVAESLGCSRLRARVTFCRARDALKKRLEVRGLDKSLLLVGLGLFGAATGQGEAVAGTVCVPASSAHVGIGTTVISAVSSKLGIGTVAAALCGFAVWGGYSALPGGEVGSLPRRDQVKSVHYTVQGRNNIVGGKSSLSFGAFEHWYYFPDGVEGSVFMRKQRWNPAETVELCTWIENEHGNYYYNNVKSLLYINNSHQLSRLLGVRVLPTDSAEFVAFISGIKGETEGVRYTRDVKTGMLLSAVDRRFLDTPLYRTDYVYNTFGLEMFEHSRPASVVVKDLRDRMHKRGWTWFRISGEMNGHRVVGRGQIPFVYGACEEHGPWMVLKIGGEKEFVDGRYGALVREPDGIVFVTYPRGSFFKGLGRPWMGMHTVDIVRRDAAHDRIRFYTTETGGKEATVRLFYRRDNSKMDLTYSIDIDNDIIKGIKFRVDGRPIGEITFSHLQDITGLEGEFVEPDMSDGMGIESRREPGIQWLIRLAENKLL